MNRLFALTIMIGIALQGLSAAPFNDNGNGTVTDQKTRLVWQKCSAGLSGARCATGSIEEMPGSYALEYCKKLSLAGKTWRLPSIYELSSIVDKTKKSSPLIDTTYFPATDDIKYYWSSTFTHSTYAKLMSFYNGSSNLDLDTNGGATELGVVRCVSRP